VPVTLKELQERVFQYIYEYVVLTVYQIKRKLSWTGVPLDLYTFELRINGIKDGIWYNSILGFLSSVHIRPPNVIYFHNLLNLMLFCNYRRLYQRIGQKIVSQSNVLVFMIWFLKYF